VKQAATNDGPSYVVIRNEIIGIGTNALPALCSLATDRDEPWGAHLVARICAERIVCGDRIDALRRKEWDKDSEFDKEWNRYHSGPTGHMTPLVTKRFKEEGLWYYYAEANWKDTDEGPLDKRLGIRVIEAWPYYAKQALEGEPESYYYVKVAVDRLEQDPELKDRANRGRYELLLRDKVMDAAPVLAKLSMAYIIALNPLFRNGQKQPSNDGHRDFVAKIVSFAGKDGANEIQKYLEANPHLEALKPKVEELKARKETTAARMEPPFRLGQKPIQEMFPFAE